MNFYGTAGAGGESGENGAAAVYVYDFQTRSGHVIPPGNGYSADPGGNGGVGLDLSGSGALTTANVYGGVGGGGGNGGNAGAALKFRGVVYGAFAGSGGQGGHGGTAVILSDGYSLTNEGTIAGGMGGFGGNAGSFGLNEPSAGIGGGGGDGVYITDATLTNFGTVAGGDTAANGSGDGVEISASPEPAGTGVVLQGGTVMNYGAISGGVGESPGAGVYISGGTLITSGSIAAGAGGEGISTYAIEFGPAASTLAVLPGATFTGQVAGAGNDTLTLSGAEVNGTPITLGTQFTGFSALDFNAGAAWIVDVAAGGAANGLAVQGFVAGDVIDFTNLTPSLVTADFGGSTTGLASGATLSTADGTLTFGGNYSGEQFVATYDGDGGADLQVVRGDFIDTHESSGVLLGIGAFQSPLTILNSGSVTASFSAAVISSVAGNELTNFGAIQGGTIAFYITGEGMGVDWTATGTLLNAGSITGGPGLAGGNTVAGIGVLFAAGMADNTGSITGGHGGAGYNGNGGAGRYGLVLQGGLFTNSGSIVGGAGGAAGTQAPANFAGGNGGAGVALDGGTLINSGLLAGGAGGASNQTPGIAGDAVVFGGPAQLDVLSGASFDGAVGGFGTDDTIDIKNLSPGTIVADFSGITPISLGGGTYVFNGSEGGETLATGVDGTLGFAGDFAGLHFTLSADGSGGTDITDTTGAACYLRGTRITTSRGDVPIESLRIGDEVTTLDGRSRPIRWIGRRHYTEAFAWRKRDLLPVCVRRGALGAGLPRRDLWVSPEHALWLDGALVPARLLVNDETILATSAAADLTYFHLEFDGHAVIFAEGAPAESFVDDDSRQRFDNAAEFHRLYPEARQSGAHFCAPRVEDGPVLEAIRRRLAERPGVRLTTNGLDHRRASDLKAERHGQGGIGFANLIGLQLTDKIRHSGFLEAHKAIAMNTAFLP